MVFPVLVQGCNFNRLSQINNLKQENLMTLGCHHGRIKVLTCMFLSGDSSGQPVSMSFLLEITYIPSFILQSSRSCFHCSSGPASVIPFLANSSLPLPSLPFGTFVIPVGSPGQSTFFSLLQYQLIVCLFLLCKSMCSWV